MVVIMIYRWRLWKKTKTHMKMVHFESDAAQLIKTINSEACLAELYRTVHDILAYASNFDGVCFSKIPREECS